MKTTRTGVSPNDQPLFHGAGRIVIEVAGGCVTRVLASTEHIEVIVRDHDNIEGGDDDPIGDDELTTLHEVW